MKILLIGDYSNVHATLAEGLRTLGHDVTVVSDGDGWKDYPRDIDIRRPSLGRWQSLRYYLRLRRLWHSLRGYDIVQLINPVFLPLRAERIWPFYESLRRHNGKVFMGAFGMDHYWVKAGTDCHTFRYSDFNLGPTPRTDLPENALFIADWLHGPKGLLNRRIAADCDGIIAGLYEYYASYEKYCPQKEKLTFIPFPIKRLYTSPSLPPSLSPSELAAPLRHPSPVREGENAPADEEAICSNVISADEETNRSNVIPPSLTGEGWQGAAGSPDGERLESPGARPEGVVFFIGIQRSRSAYKGTDIMLRALERVEKELPDKVRAVRVESVPFAEYRTLMLGSDVILDQLYSYTPAMNALEAMAQGLVVVGGGEPENYAILGEESLRPIINVEPDEESVYEALRDLALHPERLPRLKADTLAYIQRHHDHLKVAQQYLNFWTKEK